MECCVAKIKYALSNKDPIEEEVVSALICYVEQIQLLNEFVESMNSLKFCLIQ